MGYYKPRAEIELRVPPWGSSGDTTKDIVWSPKIISLKWTRNSHLESDELTVEIHYMEGGVDPRMIKHARCSMWMWDALREDLDVTKHLRFTGICKKASRKLGTDGYTIELTFHDYTTFFLMMKPFPTKYMPEYTDTLPQIWAKICDGTGYRDRLSGDIKSSVSALKNALVFSVRDANGNPDATLEANVRNATLGSLVSSRFHKIAKPSPPNRCDAWAVWQWCIASLGLVSQIDRNQVVVSNYSEFYGQRDAARLIYGQNVNSFDETADTHVSMKGILGKSFDPLKGVLIESAYPPPDDPFIKKSRAAVKRIQKGVNDALNETSADYEEYNFHWITEQAALDNYVRAAWEEFHRQEIKGKIGTDEMEVYRESSTTDPTKLEPVSLLDFSSGDCIRIGMDETTYEALKNLKSEDERVRYLQERAGYIEEVARLVARNIHNKAIASPIMHVRTLSVEYGWGKFHVDIEFHNRVLLNGENGDDQRGDVSPFASGNA